MNSTRLYSLALGLLLVGCADEDGPSPTDLGTDAGTDIGGADVADDVEPDAAPDSGLDAGDVLPDGESDAAPDMGSDVVQSDAADTGTDAPEPDAGDGTWAALYAAHIEPAGCANGYCHGGSAGGLSFTDAASAYDALVGQSVTEPHCGSITRIVPGDADSSMLYIRVRAAELDPEGCEPPKMPQGSEGLTDEAAAAIAAWIDAGAQR